MPKNRKYPTLYVKNFAKIKEAEIELAPFTLFIGDNNSGKSYLMTLIYGLMKYTSNIVNIIFENKKLLNSIEEYSKVKNIIDNYINSLNFSKTVQLDIEEDITLKEYEIREFINLFNVLLNNNIEKVVNYIFNSHNEIKLENISLNFDCYVDKLKLSVEKLRSIDKNIKYTGTISIFHYNSGAGCHFSEDNIDYISIIRVFVNFIINICFNNFYIYNSMNTYFLPVSRTGFILSYTDIIKSSIELKYDTYAFDKENQKNNLPRPVIDFLYNLVDLTNTKTKTIRKEKNTNKRIENKIFDIIKMLETNIIDGQIDVNEETSHIYYKPKHIYNSDVSEFAIYLSSAVITELAPLILFLKYYGNYKNIIMEEPEISLHPYLQQQLTRVFIKLVNSGKNVLITTHSDTIVQHINNMIKLNANEKERQKKLMKKYKYDEDDIISEDKIRMYQFDTKEDGTEVKALESSKYGFEVPTFHKYLVEVSKEFNDFIENIGENNSI